MHVVMNNTCRSLFSPIIIFSSIIFNMFYFHPAFPVRQTACHSGISPLRETLTEQANLDAEQFLALDTSLTETTDKI